MKPPQNKQMNAFNYKLEASPRLQAFYVDENIKILKEQLHTGTPPNLYKV